MATKMYCDGCGDEVAIGQCLRVEVSIKVAGQFDQAGGDYDLCKVCFESLARKANPGQWVRHGRDKVA